jgi:hypothetical protein
LHPQAALRRAAAGLPPPRLAQAKQVTWAWPFPPPPQLHRRGFVYLGQQAKKDLEKATPI